MITLTGAVSASAAILAGLHQAMQGAGHSVVELSSGEVPATAAAGSAVTAPPVDEPPARSVGALLNTHA